MPLIQNQKQRMKHKNIVYVLALLVFSGVSCQNTEPNESVSQQEEVGKTRVLTTFDSLNLNIRNQPNNPELYNERANFFLITGEYNKALADVSKAIQLDTLNPSIWITLADVYFAKERFVDSRAILLKTIKLDPQNTAALLKLSRMYFIYQDYKTALQYVDDALAIEPMLEDAYFLKGMTYAEKGDTASAIFQYQKSVEVNPDFYDAWIMLGNLQAAKQNPLAEQYYQNALNLDTNNVHAIYIMGLYYQENGNLEEAIKKYESLLAKEENENAYYNLGYVNLVYLEDFPQAIMYFQKALNLNENYYDALFNMALALELSGDKEDARMKYKELLKKVPNHEKALSQLNQLD